MNPYLKGLNRIEFVVTLACTGHCRHCSEGEHTAQGEVIDAAAAAKAVCEICEQYPIASLMTFGGEPMLYPEVVCRIHEAGKRMNIPSRELITNGYFSRGAKQIRETARMLARSGVNRILLSVDAFHQEFIPLDYVKEFAACVREEEIPIQTHPAWLVGADGENPYNAKTREILEEFQRLGIRSSGGNIIFPSGNAKKYLGAYFEGHAGRLDPYEEDPRDIRTLCFSPNGDVLHGNIYRETIVHILESYTADAV